MAVYLWPEWFSLLSGQMLQNKAPYLFPNQAWCPFLELLAPSGIAEQADQLLVHPRLSVPARRFK